jgi:hypothetical protein
MERHDPGLQAEPHDGEEKHGRRLERPCGGFIDPSPFEATGSLPQEDEEREQRHGTNVRRDEIDPCSPAGARGAVVGRDEEIGGEGHGLPAHEEEHARAGQEEERHAAGQEAVEAPKLAAIPWVHRLRPVGQAVDGSEAGDEEDGD